MLLCMNRSALHLPGMITVCAILLLASICMLVLRVPAEAAEKKCARITGSSGLETLVNTCGMCRKVQLVRNRTGIAMPTMRTYQVHARGMFPLPFKGPGQTRITNDSACSGETPQAIDDARKVGKANERCVVPMRTDRGIVIANGCGACRNIIVERRFLDGLTSNKPYSLQSKAVLALQTEGAETAQIIDEKPC